MTIANDFAEAVVRMMAIQCDIEDRLDAIFQIPEDQEWWHIGCDPSDWDGLSLELTQSDHLEATDDQQAAVFALGFDVICVHGKNGTSKRYLTAEAAERCATYHSGKAVKAALPPTQDPETGTLLE